MSKQVVILLICIVKYSVKLLTYESFFKYHLARKDEIYVEASSGVVKIMTQKEEGGATVVGQILHRYI